MGDADLDVEKNESRIHFITFNLLAVFLERLVDNLEGYTSVGLPVIKNCTGNCVIPVQILVWNCYEISLAQIFLYRGLRDQHCVTYAFHVSRKPWRQRLPRTPRSVPFIMASLFLRGFISPLQFIAAFAMVLTGIFDRVLGILSTSFIGLPVWTGLLVSFLVCLSPCVWALN